MRAADIAASGIWPPSDDDACWRHSSSAGKSRHEEVRPVAAHIAAGQGALKARDNAPEAFQLKET